MTGGPLVSIVIPVWNGERYLAAAIESALAQTHPAIEVVVVDDGSTDSSAAVTGAYDGVKLVTQPRAGIGPARNAGVAASSGEYLAFLDADDVLSPDKTTTQLKVLGSRPHVDVVYGHVEEFFSEEIPVAERPRVRIADGPIPVHALNSALLTRATFDRVGPFSELAAGQAIDWYLRSRDLGIRGHMLDAVVYRRRIHATNQGITRRDLQTDRLAALKAHLDRRRAAEDDPGDP